MIDLQSIKKNWPIYLVVTAVVITVIVILVKVSKSGDSSTAGPDSTAEADREFDKVADYASGSLIDGIRAGTITGSSTSGEDKVFKQIKNANNGTIIAIRNLLKSYKTNIPRRKELINIAVSEKIHQFHTILIREAIKELIPNTSFRMSSIKEDEIIDNLFTKVKSSDNERVNLSSLTDDANNQLILANSNLRLTLVQPGTPSDQVNCSCDGGSCVQINLGLVKWCKCRHCINV